MFLSGSVLLELFVVLFWCCAACLSDSVLMEFFVFLPDFVLKESFVSLSDSVLLEFFVFLF